MLQSRCHRRVGSALCADREAPQAPPAVPGNREAPQAPPAVPGTGDAWPASLPDVSSGPGCRALDLLGELRPCSRAYVDHRSVRVFGVPDGDQCLAGPDFDAVAVGAAVGGLPPVCLSHVTYGDRSITFREQPMARPAQSVTNSLQSAHAGHDAHRLVPVYAVVALALPPSRPSTWGGHSCRLHPCRHLTRPRLPRPTT